MSKGYPTPKDSQWPNYKSQGTISGTTNYVSGIYTVPQPKTLIDMFNNQFFLGFQEQIDRWNSLTDAKIVSFPPYNLIKADENHYTIELAVAGYTKKDIEISVEKDILTVKSTASEEKSDDIVLHQGIAKRQWSQKFVLGEWYVVKDASLSEGLLTIKIEREIPEEMKPKVIKIK